VGRLGNIAPQLFGRITPWSQRL